MNPEPSPRKVILLSVLAALSVPLAFVGYIFAGITMLGYGDSGGYDPGGTVGGVLFGLAVALVLPVFVIVIGTRRSMKRGAWLVSSAITSVLTAVVGLIAALNIVPFLGHISF
ncbi:MAG: hypothetical protein ABJA94_10560 [Rhodoglobus sp.]